MNWFSVWRYTPLVDLNLREEFFNLTLHRHDSLAECKHRTLHYNRLFLTTFLLVEKVQ